MNSEEANPLETPTGHPPWFVRFTFGKDPKRTLFRILGLLLSVYITFTFVLLPIQVSGVSMMPTYKPSQIKFVNRLAYRFGTPNRGDVVSIMTTGKRVTILKRIVGLPGERISMRRGAVYVNGEELEEVYVETDDGWDLPEFPLSDNEYWVIGDNRSVSQYEKIYIGRIIGKVLF